MICSECKAKLTSDDIGAYRKFWDRDGSDFLCVPCLCGKLKCSEAYLRERIEFLRQNGCALFAGSKQQGNSPKTGR